MLVSFVSPFIASLFFFLLLLRPQGLQPNAIDVIRRGEVDLLINIPESSDHEEITDGYRMRRCAVDFGVSLVRAYG